VVRKGLRTPKDRLPERLSILAYFDLERESSVGRKTGAKAASILEAVQAQTIQAQATTTELIQ
jgi:hypothetical protein